MMSFFRSVMRRKPFGVEIPYVARGVPAIFGKHLPRQFLVFIVATENEGTAGENLPIIGDANLHSVHRIADGAEGVTVRRVDRDRACKFSGAIHFAGVQVGGVEKFQDFARYRRGSADDHPYATAQRVFHFLEDEFLRDGVAQCG